MPLSFSFYKSNSMAAQIDRTPPAARKNKGRGWFDSFDLPRVIANKAMVVAVMMALVAILEGAIIYRLVPLKEKTPYFVEVETTGRVVQSERTATELTVDEKHIRWALGDWAANLMTIDSRTKEHLLPASYVVLRGNALGQWRNWVEVEDRPLRRLVENPALRREAKVISIAFIADGVALVRMQLTEGASSKRKAITVHYSLIPPKTDEEVMKSPIGFTITDFVVADELV